MPLLNLANELVLMIAENLENAEDLLSLSHANQRFASLLTPLFVGHMIERDGAEGALFWATAFRSEFTVRTVLKKGRNIDVVVDKANVDPPLPLTGTDDRLVKFIMDMNIMLELRGGQEGSNLTPLCWAVENGRLGLIRVLISNGLHVNNIPWGIRSSTSKAYRQLWDEALLKAAGIGAEEAAEILLGNNANIEVEGPGHLRPLHKAVEGEHLGMVRLLLDKDADPLGCVYRFIPPYSPIDMAIQKGYASIWALMIRHVSVEFRDSTNRPALVIAAGAGDLGLVAFLLENFADIESRDVNGRTALHLAAKGGYTDICELLVNEGANTEVADNTGRTPLHTAAVSRETAAIQVLVMMGADVTVVDNNLSTPLHMAGRSPFAADEDIKALIEAGAPMDVEDNHNKTPLQVLDAMTTARITRSNPVRSAAMVQ